MEENEDCGCTEKRWLVLRVVVGAVIGAALCAGIDTVASELLHGTRDGMWIGAAIGLAIGGFVAYKSGPA